MAMRLDPNFKERRQAIIFLCWTIPLCFLAFWASLYVFIPFTILVGNGFSNLRPVIAFYQEAINPIVPIRDFLYWFYDYLLYEPRHYKWTSFFAWKVLILPLISLIIACGYFVVNNPYDYSIKNFGYGREAAMRDIKKMGLLVGKYLLVGLFQGKKLRLTEPRSGFCAGAVLSGKTAGVAIPNILESDNMCLFCHDPKGELARLTSGYRSKLGPTFIFDFSLGDDPAKGVYHPCWNPLADENLPPQGRSRDSYISALVDFLIPDSPGGSNTDPYWARAGRGGLIGLTIYVCNKVEQAKANDYFLARLFEKSFNTSDADVLYSYYGGMQPTSEVKQAMKHIEEGTMSYRNYLPIGSWDPLPRQWIGKDASFGMLLDVINNWMFSKTIELRKRAQEGDPSAIDMDVWKVILDVLVNETFFYGYGRRALLELNQILSLPDKQRASVISMSQSGINLFKNSAIRNRTSSNDFRYQDLRGMKNPKTGKIEPVTFYVNNEGGAVCSLFINMLGENLMEYGPNEGGFGPHPVGFILDDFGRMPKLQLIADGITFGRSKENIFLVIVHDYRQIVSLYGENTADVILNAVGARIVKRQNNEESRFKMLAGIMKLTRRVQLSSKDAYGFGKSPAYLNFQMGGYKRVEDTVIGGAGVMNMALDRQLIVITGYSHRPIQGNSPLFFKNESMLAKSKIKPANPVPEYLLTEKRKANATLDIQLDALDNN